MESEFNMEDIEDTNIDSLEEFESSPGVDVYQFEGKQVPIEKIHVEKILSKYGPDGKQLAPGKEILAPVLKIESAVVLKGKSSKGEDYEIRASELFSLKMKVGEDGKEKIGWSHHEKGALNKFLKKMRVKHPSQLMGKLVLLTPRPGKDESVFLGFVKE